MGDIRNLFRNLVQPLVVEYFYYDDSREGTTNLEYFSVILRKPLGPFKEEEHFGGLGLQLNDDGSIDVTIDVLRFDPHRLPSGEYVFDYYETNPVLTELFPEEFPYQRITPEEYDTYDPWVNIDFTPYWPIEIVSQIGHTRA